MNKRIILIASIILFSAVLAKAGGPWTQQKGKGYFKLSEWWFTFNKHYTDAGQLDPNVTTGVFNTSAYAEYGISDQFTGILNASVFSRNYMNNLVSLTTNEVIVPGEAVNSLGDMDIGLKYKLTKPSSKFNAASSLILGLPFGKSGAGSQGNLQTGDGEFNQILQFDFGGSLNLAKNVSAYTSCYTGINHRTQNYSEEFRYGVEFGLGLNKNKLWIVGKLGGVESFKNGAVAGSITSSSIFANNTEYLNAGLEANCYVSKKMGFSASFSSILRGEIIAKGTSYNVGVFLDLSK